MHLTNQLAASAAMLTMALGAQALAQTTPQTQGGAQAETQALEFNDDKLRAFVNAALEVEAVHRDFAAQAEDAEGDEELQNIAEEANQSIMQTIEGAEGITMDEYVAISEAAKTDEDLVRRIALLLRESTGEPSGG
ncbi:DUF4168 domain-containing protein [Roseitranquillus sediminis]|uniref:DUF4168 domain-containing protein n=1 Tax=Roseitranquillus sediminis TaxID=2809051 RepID=UPI001D0C214B|nr:DUF4168 domain-containing protein [Roseitranquillus sediminis]MBM9596380.1 DUF4168 domain-containing protein [Roseitranquillus sediminis]